MTAPTKQMISVREAAAIIGVHYETALKLIHDKRLDAQWVGNRFRVPQAAVDKFTGRSA